MPAQHAAKHSLRDRTLGRSFVLLGGLTLGITTGMILLGKLYLPLLAPLTLTLLLGAPILAIISGGVIARDRTRSVAASASLALALVGALLLGTLQLNLGLSQQTLLTQIPLEASRNANTTETPWLPSSSSSVTLIGDTTELVNYLSEHTENTSGTNPLTRPLSLGKTLSIAVTDTGQRNTVTVTIDP